jgi:hypothetical protein
MKQSIPEGTPIGEIETTLEWLLSHTTGFLGAILVRIYTGEGFILIHYGCPVGFSFRMGNRVVRGVAAQQLFASQDVINASLRKYTIQEFQDALTLGGPEILIPGSGEVLQKPLPNRVFSPVATERGFLFGEVRQGAAEPLRQQVKVAVTTGPNLLKKNPVDGMSSRMEQAPLLPEQGTSQERLPETILDRIFSYPGVTAAAFFRERTVVNSRGETFLEDLIEVAEDTLLTVGEILALLSTGSLGQLTLRASGNNVTIAPFEDGYLLILTEPDVKLGQIRRLVQDTACAGKG